MGTVDGTVGFGFKVDKWNYDFTEHPKYNKEEHPDLYNFLYETIESRFDLLEVDTERYGSDITGDGAVFLRNTTVRWYGVQTRSIDKLLEHTPEALSQLKQAALFLGIPYETGYLLVTSFG